MQYRCYCPDLGEETSASGIDIEAETPEEAVKRYAETRDRHELALATNPGAMWTVYVKFNGAYKVTGAVQIFYHVSGEHE